jgi:hypothetical protein
MSSLLIKLPMNVFKAFHSASAHANRGRPRPRLAELIALLYEAYPGALDVPQITGGLGAGYSSGAQFVGRLVGRAPASLICPVPRFVDGHLRPRHSFAMSESFKARIDAEIGAPFDLRGHLAQVRATAGKPSAAASRRPARPPVSAPSQGPADGPVERLDPAPSPAPTAGAEPSSGGGLPGDEVFRAISVKLLSLAYSCPLRPGSLRESVFKLRPKIGLALDCGLGWSEVAAVVSNGGITVSAERLKVVYLSFDIKA